MRLPLRNLATAVLLSAPACAPPPSNYPPSTTSLVELSFAPPRDLDITTPRGKVVQVKSVVSLQGRLISGTADSIVFAAAMARIANGTVNHLPAAQTLRLARSDGDMRVLIRDTRPGMIGFALVTGSIAAMALYLGFLLANMN